MPRAIAMTAILILAGAAPAFAAEGDNFYQGKQIRLIIGSGTGGGYDLYARTLAQYMPRHIPGNPAIVPQNVPNAVQVVNDLAFTLPHDGTVFAGFASGMPTAPFFHPDQAKFDASKLTWIGSANIDVQTDYVWSTVPVTSVEDLRKREVILGAVIPGDATVDFPLLCNAFLGFKYRLVTGYHTRPRSISRSSAARCRAMAASPGAASRLATPTGSATRR
jgi:hypothetical protein